MNHKLILACFLSMAAAQSAHAQYYAPYDQYSTPYYNREGYVDRNYDGDRYYRDQNYGYDRRYEYERQRVEEQRRLEEQRRYNEQRVRAEEQRRLQDQQRARLEEQHRLQEQQRARLEEQNRLQEQRRLATRSPYGPIQTAVPGEGAGPGRNIRLGDPIPPQYYNDRFVVEDWAARGLSQPAGSFKWFQVGNDYVQVNLNNGLVGMVVVSR